jgi:hypothetical protein
MLRNWERYGIAHCQNEFVTRHAFGGTPSKAFKELLKGRIDFIGYVRRRNDPLYLKLLERLKKLDASLLSAKSLHLIKLAKNHADHILDNLWVIESVSSDGKESKQGTGFYVKGLGIITCAHTLYADSKIDVYRRDGLGRFDGFIRHLSESLDLAILTIADFPEFSFEIEIEEPKPGDLIKLAGFPHFAEASTGIVDEGYIIGSRKDVDRNRQIIISADILHGNSGGPIFNDEWKVIGVASRGNRSADTDADRHFNQFIPIESIFRLGK